MKDWIIDDLIKRSIEDEFKGHGLHLSGIEIYREMFSRLGIDISLLSWDFRHNLIGYNTIIGSIDFDDCYHHSQFAVKPSDEDTKRIEQQSAVYKFKMNFDVSLFEKLVLKQIYKTGFKKKVITNIHGQKVELNSFVISRERLENKCCGNPEVEDEQRKSSENIWSGILVVIAIAIIAFVYAMS